MPQIVWMIDDQDITLVDRARLGVTLRLPGAEPVSIPPLVLGTWRLALGDRRLALRSVRNLDRLRYQLWCEGHLLPRGRHDRRPANGEVCAQHAAEPALCLCTRCDRPSCKSCSPNGIHCSRCLDVLADEDRAEAVRSRRVGLGVSIALGIVALVGGQIASLAGVRAGAPLGLELGGGILLLVVFLYGRGIWRERNEREEGHPAAIDPPRPPPGWDARP